MTNQPRSVIPALSQQDAPSNSGFTSRDDRLYAQEVKINSWVAFVLLLLCLPLGSAQQSTGFRATNWSPQRLESGSPVFFKVALDQPASALHGTWLKHDIVFTRARDNTWYALAGIDVQQEPGTYALELTATATDGHPLYSKQEVTILPAHYKTTTLHVEEKYVQPDAATLQRIAADKVVKDAAFAHLIPEPLWNGSFRSPVPFTATDSFGTRRMFNGELASVHRGTDFHAPSGTPVLAANDGQVIIAQPMFYEGNLVVIDHGQQFTTLYMHLSKIEVKVGDQVRKGQRLGLSGATGRVTGPHLHLSARWQGEWVDPVVLLHLPLPSR
jgi:murein DD-endopeptidase MepM/ murein hydrolase activator NlpD